MSDSSLFSTRFLCQAKFSTVHFGIPVRVPTFDVIYLGLYDKSLHIYLTYRFLLGLSFVLIYTVHTCSLPYLGHVKIILQYYPVVGKKSKSKSNLPTTGTTNMQITVPILPGHTSTGHLSGSSAELYILPHASCHTRTCSATHRSTAAPALGEGPFAIWAFNGHAQIL
jgi:hypothetical protein